MRKRRDFYYFHELIERLGINNYAFCISHAFPEGKEIMYIEGKGIVWKGTNKLVELDWVLLSSKWQIIKIKGEK